MCWDQGLSVKSCSEQLSPVGRQINLRTFCNHGVNEMAVCTHRAAKRMKAVTDENTVNRGVNDTPWFFVITASIPSRKWTLLSFEFQSLDTCTLSCYDSSLKHAPKQSAHSG